MPRQLSRRVGRYRHAETSNHDAQDEDGGERRTPDPLEEEHGEQRAGGQEEQCGDGQVEPFSQEHSEQERRCDR